MATAEIATVEDARDRLRAAISRVIEVFVARKATAAEFTTWAQIVEEFADRIQADPPETVFWGLGTRGMFTVAGHPVDGRIVPVEPIQGDRIEASVTFGIEHEGWKGMAHGGVIAGVFDTLFGMFWSASEPRRVTSNLDIRYLAPTPIGAPIRLEGHLEQIDGRRYRCSGLAYNGHAVCAEATAIFVTMTDLVS